MKKEINDQMKRDFNKQVEEKEDNSKRYLEDLRSQDENAKRGIRFKKEYFKHLDREVEFVDLAARKNEDTLK